MDQENKSSGSEIKSKEPKMKKEEFLYTLNSLFFSEENKK